MSYTVFNLMATGILGILVHNLIKINNINKRTDGQFKAGYFFRMEWASIAISLCVVIVCLIARNEVKQLREVGNYLMLGFFFIGLGSQSIAYTLSSRIEKKIESTNDTTHKQP